MLLPSKQDLSSISFVYFRRASDDRPSPHSQIPIKSSETSYSSVHVLTQNDRCSFLDTSDDSSARIELKSFSGTPPYNSLRAFKTSMRSCSSRISCAVVCRFFFEKQLQSLVIRRFIQVKLVYVGFYVRFPSNRNSLTRQSFQGAKMRK